MLQLIFLLVLVASANSQCVGLENDIQDILTSSPIVVTGACQGSFFQIEILANATGQQYNFTIKDQVTGIVLINLFNDPLDDDKKIFLGSQSNEFEIDPLNNVENVIPLKIHYKEIVPTNISSFQIDATSQVINGSDSVIADANFHKSYNFIVDNLGDQLLDITWYSRGSASTGFTALRTKNDRIKLITSHFQNPLKLAVNTNETLSLDFITQNHPSDNNRTEYKVFYSFGKDIPTTSTVIPVTTTPGPLARATIFVLEINEEKFVAEYESSMKTNLTTLAERTKCTLTFSRMSNCRKKCSMTDNPVRGCISFEVVVERTVDYYFCLWYTNEKLSSSIQEELIETWKRDFSVKRIELNECFSDIQQRWLGVAVGVPVVVAAFLAAAVVLKKFFDIRKKKTNVQYRPMNYDHQNSSSLNRRNFLSSRSQFEIVDDFSTPSTSYR